MKPLDLRARIPALVDACHALAASGVPDSLEHGDLTADEVILGEMGPVFLDWSDGSITHPFLSAASLLADRTDDDDRAEAYLGPWLAAGIVTERCRSGGARTGADRPAAPPRGALRRPDPAGPRDRGDDPTRRSSGRCGSLVAP